MKELRKKSSIFVVASTTRLRVAFSVTGLIRISKRLTGETIRIHLQIFYLRNFSI